MTTQAMEVEIYIQLKTRKKTANDKGKKSTVQKPSSGKKDDRVKKDDGEDEEARLRKYLTCVEPYPSYYVGDVSNFARKKEMNKLEYLFILESPYIEEVEKSYPLAGNSGKSVSKMLLGDNREAFGEIIKPKGQDNIDSTKICVINVSQVPLDVNTEDWDKKNQITCKVNKRKFKDLKTATDGLYSKLNYIRTQQIYNKIKKCNTTILEQFCKRLNEYIVEGNENLCIVLCGSFAQVYFDCAKEKCDKLKTKINNLEKENILYLPHPSCNQWENINKYNDNFEKLKNKFKELNQQQKNKKKVKCKTSKSYKLKKGVTMKKILSNWLFWLAIGLLVLFIANLAYGIWGCNGDDNNKTNYLTIISGWISGLATLAVGLIAYKQARKYKKQEIMAERNVDVFAECIEYPYTAVDLPSKRLGKKWSITEGKDYEYKYFRFFVYNYLDNCVFDLNIKQLTFDENTFYYDKLDKIERDIYGKTVMIKNDLMFLVGELPYNKNSIGDYEILLTFKNQYGDTYEKTVKFKVNLSKASDNSIIEVTQTASKCVNGEI